MPRVKSTGGIGKHRDREEAAFRSNFEVEGDKFNNKLIRGFFRGIW